MKSGEFELRAINRGYSPDHGDEDERLSNQDLNVAFEALGEELFLVDRHSGDIVWMSPACKALTHKLGLSRNIGEFPVLKKLVNSATPKDVNSQMHSRWHTHDATWEQYIGNHQKSAISVYVSQSKPDSIWVRLTRFTDREEYLRQYVAEQEELFNTSRAVSVGEIATTLAHELNQPLGTLLNIVNGIKSRLHTAVQNSDEIYKALELAEKQAHFASEILLRVRSFAKARKPDMGLCNVQELIEETLTLLDWKFRAEHVSVNFSVSEKNLTVCGDGTLLQQVLVNLIRNAVESMANVNPDKRFIGILAVHKDASVVIDICDAGHGIDTSKMDEPFTLFNSNKPNGMGVGLNICLSFIELHQGKFWFTQNDGAGCTAHIQIPDSL